MPSLRRKQVDVRLGSLAASLVLMLPVAASADERSDRLRDRVLALGDVRPELIDDAVTAAIDVETESVSAELLLALAWWESRLEPGLRTGRVCGALQVKPEDVGERSHRDACHRWAQDTWQGFRAGADELTTWLRHSHGNMSLALRGRACGWTGLRHGCGKKWWIDRVRLTARRLKEAS